MKEEGWWFAWYPVYAWGKLVWLKKVWRTATEYRLTRPRGEITNSIFKCMTEEEKNNLLIFSHAGGMQHDGEGGWIVLMGSKSFERLITYEHGLIDKYETLSKVKDRDAFESIYKTLKRKI